MKSQRCKIARTLCLLAIAGLVTSSAQAATPATDASQPFSFAILKDQARRRAAQPYQAPQTQLPEPISNLTWDQMQAIGYRPDHALWADSGLKFRVSFFHLGLYNKLPVTMYEVIDGRAHRIRYDSAAFDYGTSGVRGADLPPDLGFAGFRLAFHTDWRRDVAAFQGASYFRRERRQTVWIVGPRLGRRLRTVPARGVSQLHRLLAGASGARSRPAGGLCPARFAQRRGLLPL